MPRLWVCTWSPAEIGAVATPITWPYFRSGAPSARARTATLCPRGTPSRSRRATATSSSGCSSSVSPVMHAPVLQTVDRQVGLTVGILRGRLLVDVDAETRLLRGVQHPVGEPVGVGEDRVRGRGVRHVLLDAEVRHRDVDVQPGGLVLWRLVGGVVCLGLFVVLVGLVVLPALVGVPS